MELRRDITISCLPMSSSTLRPMSRRTWCIVFWPSKIWRSSFSFCPWNCRQKPRTKIVKSPAPLSLWNLTKLPKTTIQIYIKTTCQDSKTPKMVRHTLIYIIFSKSYSHLHLDLKDKNKDMKYLCVYSFSILSIKSCIFIKLVSYNINIPRYYRSIFWGGLGGFRGGFGIIKYPSNQRINQPVTDLLLWSEIKSEWMQRKIWIYRKKNLNLSTKIALLYRNLY